MPRFRPTARLLVLDPADRAATCSGRWATEDGLTFFGADAFFGVRVAEPWVDTDGQEALERSVITGYRWWTTAGVPTTPVRLPWRLGT